MEVEPDDTLSESTYAPLSRVQRAITSALGLVGGGAGAAAVFKTNNGAGTAALLLLAALFLLIGVLGVVPVKLKIGDSEVTLQRTLVQTLRNLGLSSDGSPSENLRGLAVAYDVTRRALPAGGQRTVALESLLLQARSLAAALAAADLQSRFASFPQDSDGARVITLALMEARPSTSDAALNVLVDAVKQPRSNFEQYHGLRAASEALPTLPDATLAELRHAAQGYLDDPRSNPKGDRGLLAYKILSRPS